MTNEDFREFLKAQALAENPDRRFDDELSDQFNERLKAHTVPIDPSEDCNPMYAAGMLNLFVKIDSFGETYELPEADIAIIRETGLPQHDEKVIKPYFTELAKRLYGPDHVVELAGNIERMHEALAQANAEYYLAAVSKLSDVGQDAINKAFISESQDITPSKTNFAALANEYPQIMRAWLQTMLQNYLRTNKDPDRIHRSTPKDPQDGEQKPGVFNLTIGGDQ